MSTKIPKRPPSLLRVCIDSQHSYQTFLKRHDTHTHSLKMEYASNVNNPHLRRQLRTSLLTIARTSKHIRSICLHSCPLEEFLYSKEIIKVIKRFPYIRKLFTRTELFTEKIRTLEKFLTVPKYLESFDCSPQFRMFSFLVSNFDVTRHSKRFFLFLKRVRLNKLRLELSDNVACHFSQLFKPDSSFTSLKKLIFYRISNLHSKTDDYLDSFKISLQHMYNLQALGITFPVKPKTIASLLSSLPHPSKLTFLNVNLISEAHDPNLVEVLKTLKGLETLIIRLPSPNSQLLDALGILNQFSIKHLEIDTTAHGASDVSSLGTLLGSLRALVVLKLSLRATYFGAMKNSPSFFKQLSQLINLQAIELRIYTPAFFSERTPGYLSSFSQCLESLPEVREVVFDYSEADFEEEFAQLIQVLRKRAKQLKVLDLTIKNQKLKPYATKMLPKLIKEAESLEVLGLDGVHFEKAEFFNKISKALEERSSLNVLALVRISGKVNQNRLVKMLNRVLVRPGFKVANLIEGRGLELLYTKKKNSAIDLKKVVQKNPRLKMAILPNCIVENGQDMLNLKWGHLVP